MDYLFGPDGSDDITQSCLIQDLKSQATKSYSITEEQIADIAEKLRNMPEISRREYARLAQLLSVRLSAFYNYVHLTSVPISDLKTLLDYAPWGDMYELIEKYGEYYRFFQLESAQISYLCGMMIHEISDDYHTRMHRKNADRLVNLGVDGLQDLCRKVHTDKIHSIIHSCGLDPTVPYTDHMGCTTDTLTNELTEYFPFDVVYYLNENQKIFGIARTDFDYVMKKRENPWTRERIPRSTIVEIENRRALSKIYHLGDCQTITDTIEMIISPKKKCEDLLVEMQEVMKNTDPRKLQFRELENPLASMTQIANIMENAEPNMISIVEESSSVRSSNIHLQESNNPSSPDISSPSNISGVANIPNIIIPDNIRRLLGQRSRPEMSRSSTDYSSSESSSQQNRPIGMLTEIDQNRNIIGITDITENEILNQFLSNIGVQQDTNEDEDMGDIINPSELYRNLGSRNIDNSGFHFLPGH